MASTPATPAISPWPLPPSATRVIIVGGTFDPPHAAHTRLPAHIRDRLLADHALLFVPAAASPLRHAEASTAPNHRLAMIRLAARDIDRSAVWSDEIDRAEPGHPSYTIDTLRRARSVAPHVDRFRLFIGADQAAAFHHWRQAREVIRLASPLVLLRGEHRAREGLIAAMAATGAWTQDELTAWRAAVVDAGPDFPQSATAIRDTIRREGVAAVPRGWLAPQVASYIASHGLYGAS